MKTAKERLLNALAPDVDGVFVSSELNIFYLTNFDYTDGFVLVTRNKSYVITDFRYAEAAKAAVSDEFEIVVPQNRMLIEIASLLEENGVKKLMFEDGFVSCADHARFADLFKGCELVPGGTDVLSTLREVKTEAELEKINSAQKITDAAFAHILEFIKPEMTELEVALELEFFMRRMGAQSTAFDTIAVSGASSSLPHGVPQARKLEKGFFTMDFGARLDGYCSDMTRTVVLGKADEDMKKLYNTVLSAQLAALEAIHEGAENAKIDKIARDIIDNAGYKGCFGHGLGHGVGLYIHESPRVSSGVKEGTTLAVGNVVTVEPGIYIEGKYGCRIEDMVAATKDGIRNFTQSPKELIELF